VSAIGIRRCQLVCDVDPAPVLVDIELPDAPTTIGDLLTLARQHPRLRDAAIAWDEAPTGIWGQLRPRQHGVQAGDRVELYRRLPRDPKQARRARATAARRASGTVK
jgi:putative ubiquitin-RnfH superfamily antitoxin RatB of RatAB toxin-antitoxin module